VLDCVGSLGRLGVDAGTGRGQAWDRSIDRDRKEATVAWLVLGERVLAAVEVAETPRQRMRGLLGRDGIDGAMLLRPARSVHTMRMRFAIDVAFCDREMRVLRIVTMVPNRLGRPVWRARGVIEAEAGRMAHWGLHVGDRLLVGGDGPSSDRTPASETGSAP
jgi:uncharacterized membrane protein (UPF0127 family)